MPRRTRSDRGASAVEYGLIVAGLAGSLVVGSLALQAGLASAYRATTASIESVPAAASGPGATGPTTPAPTTPAPSTPAPSTPAPSTPAPTTPAPSTPAPTTSAAPTTPAVVVRAGRVVVLDVVPQGFSRTGEPSVSPAQAGEAAWKGGQLSIAIESDARAGTVIVTYAYKKGSTVLTATVEVTVVRA